MARMYTWLKNKLEATDTIKINHDEISKKDDINGWMDNSHPDIHSYGDGPNRQLDIEEIPMGLGRDIKTFLKDDPKKIARKITDWDWNIYKYLTIEDIKSHEEETSTIINQMYCHHDQVFVWTLNKVLTVADTKMRSKIIQQYILIARALFINNNFHSAHAIVTALNYYPIQRLSKTWNKISNNKMKIFKEMTNEFADKNNNYEGLTNQMKEAHAVNNITIPYLGLFLDDFHSAMVLLSDVRLKTLERISVVLADCRRLPLYHHDNEMTTKNIDNYNAGISEHMMSLIKAESVKRSYCLQPPIKYYKIVSNMDHRTMFDFLYENNDNKF